MILQTHLKNHPIFRHVLAHAFEPFYHEEKEGRKLLQFPPYAKLAKLVFRGADGNEVKKTAEAVREALIKHLPRHFTVHPIVPCGREKVRDEYYLQCLLKATSLKPFQDWVFQGHLKPFQKNRTVQIKVDIDPTSLYKLAHPKNSDIPMLKSLVSLNLITQTILLQFYIRITRFNQGDGVHKLIFLQGRNGYPNIHFQNQKSPLFLCNALFYCKGPLSLRITFFQLKSVPYLACDL